MPIAYYNFYQSRSLSLGHTEMEEDSDNHDKGIVRLDENDCDGHFTLMPYRFISLK